jgi:hypothetical protein
LLSYRSLSPGKKERRRWIIHHASAQSRARRPDRDFKTHFPRISILGSVILPPSFLPVL